MKKFTKDMDASEVMRRLLAGEVIHIGNVSNQDYRIMNGFLCKFYDGECGIIGVSLDPENPDYYFNCPDEFKITKTGLYRTRDGRKVFVSYIDEDDDDCDYHIEGIIEGSTEAASWTKEGRYICVKENHCKDIVGEWNE